MPETEAENKTKQPRVIFGGENMKKLLFPILVILMMTAGCTCLPGSLSGGNQPPTAYIDSISPVDASVGETVSFQSHGTDADGDVVAYRWRSDVDGDLGTTASFETSSLSAGAHVVYFKVQDNNGDWSDDVRTGVTVSGDAANAPVIASFNASPAIIASGSYSTLSWSISGAATAVIDQGVGNVALTGTRVVSPGATTTYTLTASNEVGSVTAVAQVIVSAGAQPSVAGLPVISLFSANPWSIASGESTMLSWNVSNASTVTIGPGVGAVASAGSTPASPAATTSYTLTATNASGWSSVAIPVVVTGEPAGEPEEEEQAGEEADVTPPTVPVLVSPAPGAVLPQPGEPWVFDWGDSADPESGIQQYEIYVKWSAGAIPVIDVEVPNSNYSEVVGGSVGAASCSDWRWKVRAQNNAGLWSDWSPTRSFDIEPPAALPEEHTVPLFSIVGEDGYVMQDGSTNINPNVGDRGTDEAIQAFLSFDISGIPAGATIKSASLDLSTGDELGDPFDGLGLMRVYNDQYGNLGAEDFTPGFPTGAMYTYGSRPMAPFVSPGDSATMVSWIQAQVNAGALRFQVRLQFQKYTDGDGQVDCLRLGEGHPKLVVIYEE